MKSSRRFPPPWTLIRENSERYIVQDANGVTVAWLFCRDGSSRYSFGARTLTADEARRIGQAIARIPELLMPRKGFHPRGGGPGWRTDRPYHVAIEDNFLRENWFEIDALCKLNACRSTPPARLSATTAPGASTNSPGRWTRSCSGTAFKGRWLRGSEFHYPERPADLPELKPLTNWPKFNPRDTR
jgi:hypothetical protein